MSPAKAARGAGTSTGTSTDTSTGKAHRAARPSTTTRKSTSKTAHEDEPPQDSGLIEPMLATLGTLPPAALDPEFAYETKWDGMRAVAYLDRGGVRFVSRNGNDVSVAYPELTAKPLDAPGTVLDGEIIAFDDDGKPSFEALQPRMHLRDERRIPRLAEQRPVLYTVFDVMRLRGRDVFDLEYVERRALLDELEVGRAQSWTCPAYQTGDGARLFAATARAGLEGLVAKRLGSRYRPGRRSPDWIKIKHVATQEVVIGGWTRGQGRRAGTLGALLLGIPGKDGLDYVGHVGTGFSDRELARLTERLESLRSERSPFNAPLPSADARDAVWVRPELTGEVTYAEQTRVGMLRSPAWRGLRPDKSPRQVRREVPPSG